MNGHDEEREVTCSLEVSVDLTRQFLLLKKHTVAKHYKNKTAMVVKGTVFI